MEVAKILKPKIEAYGIVDVLGMAISKTMTERLMTPYIGNGTIKSGLIKGVVGGLSYGKLGKYGNMVASGMIFDAAEDVALVATQMFMGSGQKDVASDDF